MAEHVLRIGSTVNSQRTGPEPAPLPSNSMSETRRVPRPAEDKPLSPLGERLKKAWEHADMTQSTLERRLVERGLLSRGDLSKIKYGDRARHSIDPMIVLAIAHVCGVDFTWLLTAHGAMLPPRSPPLPPLAAEAMTPHPPSSVKKKP
jgi:hypothetical protein